MSKAKVCSAERDVGAQVQQLSAWYLKPACELNVFSISCSLSTVITAFGYSITLVIIKALTGKGHGPGISQCCVPRLSPVLLVSVYCSKQEPQVPRENLTGVWVGLSRPHSCSYKRIKSMSPTPGRRTKLENIPELHKPVHKKDKGN